MKAATDSNDTYNVAVVENHRVNVHFEPSNRESV